ncbi:lipopolysaccharide biosynthesis protein [Marinifilum sp. RC60d5]|uniref:lipopolysaccharide biosynthesis protein n=1 Tax=Marinifilum sp. RC60d5 TaxID=3458414 RepID=UPI004035779B
MQEAKTVESKSIENNKRIAKNTLLLYFRMLLIMGVSLYTVRIVLDTLGAVDYGLYNVVGGIIVMFSFLSNTMASASQRFFAFELGRKNYDQLKKTFSMTMTIYGLIAILILILAETVGLWFLNTQLAIPMERKDAANWVYQFTIFSFMITMITVPYNAAIISHERMKVYAYVSILEAILKLVVVYFLVLFSYDKLKLYAVLTFGVTLLITFVYRRYCKKKLQECTYSYYWNKALFKKLIGYSGWNLFGSLAALFNNQGINILLNIFFGPVVNAARAIAYQISNAINQFVSNFMTATRPQITKYYANGENENMLSLVFRSSKFSYLLLFMLSMPALLETKFILTVWLKEIPEYVITFTRLIIITSLIDSLSYPLMTAAQATGKIKLYQVTVGGMMLANIPVSYFFLKMNYPPQSVLYIAIVNSFVCLFIRLLLLRQMVGLSIIKFIRSIIFIIILVSLIAYIIPMVTLFKLEEGIYRFLLVSFLGLISSLTSSLLIGLTPVERSYAYNILQKTIKKKIH